MHMWSINDILLVNFFRQNLHLNREHLWFKCLCFPQLAHLADLSVALKLGEIRLDSLADVMLSSLESIDDSDTVT